MRTATNMEMVMLAKELQIYWNLEYMSLGS